MEHKYTLLSLFTGAGGLDYGFESTGRFVTKLALEHQPEFCETLRGNQARGYLSESIVMDEDVTAIDPVKACQAIAIDWRPDGIIGGPPCQSFSQMGKRKGLQDPRGELVFVFFDWIRALKPRFFLMENVPDLATIQDGQVLKDLLLKFSQIGYKPVSQVLMAADYGAATLRKRLFIVAIQHTIFEFPPPTHAPTTDLPLEFGLAPYVTAGIALQGLTKAAEKPPGVPNGHYHIKHTPTVTARFAQLPEGGYDPVRKRTKLATNKPSPSLVAGNLNGIRSHIHPIEPRELTNRESARIQGFPDNFEFYGNHAAMGLQIANSVPIAFGKALATAIAEHLDQ